MTVVYFKMVIAEIYCFEFAIERLTHSQTVIFPKIVEAIFVVEMLTLKSAGMRAHDLLYQSISTMRQGTSTAS